MQPSCVCQEAPSGRQQGHAAAAAAAAMGSRQPAHLLADGGDLVEVVRLVLLVPLIVLCSTLVQYHAPSRQCSVTSSGD